MKKDEKILLVVMVGLVIAVGVWLVAGRTSGKKVEKTAEPEVGTFQDKQGKSEETRFITGVAKSWVPDEGKIVLAEVKTDKEYTFVLNDKKANIIVAEQGGKTGVGTGVDRTSAQWKSAFCPGDQVTVGFNTQNEATFVNNQGPRMCGLKE